MKPKCSACGDCCQFLVFQSIDTPDNREFLAVRGCEILDTDGETMDVKINIPCPRLNYQNKCDYHGTDKMPEVCRVFPEPGQEKLLPFCAFNISDE